MAASDIVEVTIVLRDGTEQKICGPDVAERACAVISLFAACFVSAGQDGGSGMRDAITISGGRGGTGGATGGTGCPVEPPPADVFVSALDAYMEARLSMALGRYAAPSTYVSKEREVREALDLLRATLRALGVKKGV